MSRLIAILTLLPTFLWAAGSNGKFSIETTPKAMIIVDDIPVRESPLRNLVLPPGTHKFEYQKGTAQPVEFQLMINADYHLQCTYNFETTTHKCKDENLKPVKADGSFEATSNLPADVTLDGKSIGKTPIAKTKVSIGKHKLVFTAGDAEPVVREIEVNAREHVEVEVVFEKPKK